MIFKPFQSVTPIRMNQKLIQTYLTIRFNPKSIRPTFNPFQSVAPIRIGPEKSARFARKNERAWGARPNARRASRSYICDLRASRSDIYELRATRSVLHAS